MTQQIARVLPAGSGQMRSVVESTVTGVGPAALVSIAFLLVSGTRVFAALSRADAPRAGSVRDPPHHSLLPEPSTPRTLR